MQRKSGLFTAVDWKAALLTVSATMMMAAPAAAQYVGSEGTSFDKDLASTSTNSTAINHKENAINSAPVLGAAPPAVVHRAAEIGGVNTAGSVRINMLANLEALINIGANGTEIVGVCWGIALIVLAFFKGKNKTQGALFGLIPLVLGALSPSAINFAIAAARDANFFS